MTRLSRVALLAAALALGACDILSRARAGLKDVESDEGMGRATLRVEVDPPDAITILLDEARVGSVSPWVGTNLKPGPHTLQVRAMGFYPISIPVTLVDDDTVSVPVALRRRPIAEPVERAPRKGRAPPRETPPPPPPPPDAPGPEVPPGVEPIDLTVAATPKAPISLDGLAADGRALTLKRTNGSLQIGDVTFAYRIGGRGLLFITPPNDGATWTLDGKPVRGGTPIKQNVGISRLARQSADGATLNVLIKR